MMADEGETVDFDDCVKEDFALPALMVWAPELRWPDLYPDSKPMCPFHKTTDCVEHKGIGDRVRRCFGHGRNVALARRRYICTCRMNANEHPYCFDSAQQEVMDLAPDYVQGYWRENGFILSRKCDSYRGQWFRTGLLPSSNVAWIHG
jgi:hypothetical protein